MLEEMRIDVQTMMSWKAKVISNIREEAESAVLKYNFDPDLKLDYYNAKKLYEPGEPKPLEPGWMRMEFSPHRSFDGVPVNINHSVVHVPTNVYDKSPEVLNAIKWSEKLNPTFQNNFMYDPSLIWQFFGSATGFLRLFPATKWRVLEGPDMYDCRMRPWYIQGAASAKDIVILLDGSGSMTGLRKEIARNVVLNILETLSDNDFVTILRFSESVKSVVPCFENTLVQATEENLREFRELLKDLDTVNIANFTLGLITAFELLQKVAKNNEGSQCNQAIMLITDGAPYTYEKIFQQYNWPNIPVRVFTYLIGREVTDMDEVQWMACYNRGYYTHVTTLAEVREQVQKYIPVMSRPVVLSGEHPIVWSSVYADVSDVKLSDWLWRERERVITRKCMLEEIENQRKKREEDTVKLMNEESQMGQMGNISISHYMASAPAEDYPSDAEFYRRPYKRPSVQLLITVATPVFDKRNFSNVTERIRSSKNIWIERTKEMRVANILGVAGTDVPIREIIKLTPPHKLGVNGYSFVVTNNGFVLYHPDLRPLFQDMLKPQYNTVDMTEVELVDDDKLGPREFDETLLGMKNSTINRRIGWQKLSTKLHLDSMSRVVTRNNSYYYGPIDGTPFSLVIVLPESYGRYRVSGQIAVKEKSENLSKLFEKNNWRVHPDWVYCESQKNENEPYISPEDVIRNFIKEAENTQNFKWRTTSTNPPMYNVTHCDKHLVQSLVFDAKATDFDVETRETPNEFYSREQMKHMHGIVTTFVATRSGLLRFHDYRTEEEKANSTERPFYETHTKAIDELFYRRAVDFYHINSSAFVFAVPFDAGSRGSSLVTASQAIFLGKGKKKAPAAVVGVQFQHAAFKERFLNMTGTCQNTTCIYKCTDKEMDCFLLDNNGFVVVSENNAHTGKFFGEIDFTLFEILVEENIYRSVRMFDYQAICIDEITSSGPASILKTPLCHFGKIMNWLWSKLIMLFVHTNVFPWLSEHIAAATGINCEDYILRRCDNCKDDDSQSNEVKITRKYRPRPCDKEFYLYEMRPSDSWEPLKGVLPNSLENLTKNYIVQRVPHTNLIMLVTYIPGLGDLNQTDDRTGVRTQSLAPEEVIYEEEVRCQRMRNGTIRKLPESCVHHHPEEGSIGQQCGLGSLIRASIYLVVGALLLRLL
ncbi:voltage-dependent calcium channel subunit alpha-2/delta-3-like isoform X2 [Stegodyphus dumicola]|uniref:voltage-dependent calcium channel subunit alpha-2/delta-3-like isoform X2 n=1 Tax=Stegodyphus dumicola TaxID=202533 RepID=UPI0015AEF34E|nr:voltage-dependent calcium channel subunit alpha-2/delta-3-like isoform X2 [Stegodyphus dumicola]